VAVQVSGHAQVQARIQRIAIGGEIVISIYRVNESDRVGEVSAAAILTRRIAHKL
jgi:hypothetical protein